MRIIQRRSDADRIVVLSTTPADVNGFQASIKLHMTKLSIRFLGECQFIYDGEVVTGLQTKRMRSLMGYLLLHAGQQISATQLAFLFWPDSSEKQARTNLRGLFHSLRNAFPQHEEFLERSDHTVTWRLDGSYELDVNRFDEQLGKAHRSIQSDQPQRAHEALEAAIVLYRGNLLPGCYDDWILAVREQLRQGYLSAIEQRMDLLENEGDYRAAIDYGEMLLREDSLRERPYRSLMQLHALSGDRANALRVYHACASELERELGVEPHSETKALYQRLLKVEQPVVAGSEPSDHAVESGQLIGRQAERRRLFAAWRTAALGRATFVLIRGEAGIGKTRLAEELYRWTSHLGIDAVRARAYAASTGLAYAPLLEWLRSSLLTKRLASLEPIWLSELARLLPDILVDFPQTPTPQPLAEEWQRLRLFEALARVICANSEPMLLWLDDLQWCDGETLAWLQYLVQYQPAAPLLLLGTARDEELAGNHPLAELTHHLRRVDLLVEIDLHRLSADETELLGSQIAGNDLRPAEAEQLNQDAGGIPLFVVEMVRAGLSGWESEHGQQAASSGVETVDSATALPLKVYSVIQSRLAQLTPPAATLAALAATIGKSFTYDLLHQASELDEDQLVQSLDELWRQRIIREQGVNAADYAYDFTHDRIRDVAYAELSTIRRRFFHRAVASSLESIYAGKRDEWSAELAHHYAEAGNRTTAGRYFRLAGERAARQFAHRDAISYFSRALDLAGEEDPAAAFALLGLRERAHHMRGNRLDQEENLVAMMALADGLEDERRRATVLLRRAERAEGQGDYDRAVGYAQEAMVRATGIGNRRLEAEGVIRLGSALWNRGDYTRSEEAYRQGLDIVRATDEPQLETTILLHLGALYVYHAPYSDAHQICEQALAAAKRADDVEGEIWANNQLGYLLVEQGDDDGGTAESYLSAGLELARKIGHRPYIAKLSTNLGRLYDHRGKDALAMERFQESLAIAEETGSTRHKAFALNFRGNALINQGRFEGAQQTLDEALALFETIGYRQGVGKTMSEMALLSAIRGAYDEALNQANAALAIAVGIDIQRDRAYALARQGYAFEGLKQWQDACRAYEQALSIYEQTRQVNRSLEPRAGLVRIFHILDGSHPSPSMIDSIVAGLNAGTTAHTIEAYWVSQTCRRFLKAENETQAADLHAVTEQKFMSRPGIDVSFPTFPTD